MPGLFSCPAFAGFGPTYLAAASPPLGSVTAARSAGLRARLRADCPRRPGVYAMLQEHGDLIYVGKAKNLRGRLLSYFRPKSRDPRAGRIIRQARTIVWEAWTTELQALLRELELIRRWRPRWNVMGQPSRRRRTYLCLGRQPAAYAY